MNPIIARLYPTLHMRSKSAPKPMTSLRDIMNNNRQQEEKSKNVQFEKHIEIDVKPIVKQVLEIPKSEAVKAKSFNDELDDYITELEKKYETIPELERKSSRPNNLRKKETAEEKKTRLLTALSKKRVSKAEQYIDSVKEVFDNHKGDDLSLKKEEQKLRKGIQLIRQARILKETGDFQNNIEDNNI